MMADDHLQFRRVVKDLLGPLVAEFAECIDGLEAVAQFPQFRPDVVLMDIAMAGLDGLRATAQIIAQFPDAAVLILTQYDDPELRAAAQSAGAAGYVLKENLSELPSIVREHLAMAGQGSSAITGRGPSSAIGPGPPASNRNHL